MKNVGNYYELKFERERRPRPVDWIIVPAGRLFKMVRVGGMLETQTNNQESEQKNERAGQAKSIHSLA